MKQKLENELSRVNRDLRDRQRKYRGLRNMKREYEAMQVFGVTTIDEFGTERTMQVLEVPKGLFNQQDFGGTKK